MLYFAPLLPHRIIKKPLYVRGAAASIIYVYKSIPGSRYDPAGPDSP